MATVTEASTETYTVSGMPTLQLATSAGDIRIVAGEGSSVTFAITKRTSALTEEAAREALARLEVEITQVGDQITLKTKEQRIGGFFQVGQNRRIDIVITTPAATNLDIATNSGDVEIIGIQGALTAKLNSGDLRLDQVRIDEQASFDMNSGDIAMRGVTITAPVRFKLNSGDVELQDVTFMDAVRFITNSGDIKGELALGSSGQLRVETNSGDVYLALPASIAAHLEATIRSGDIRIKGFPVSASHRYGQSHAIGDLNPAPTSTIAVELNSGDLVLTAQ